MALSATEKHEMRMWGIDVDAVAWPDGTKPPPWVKASTDNNLFQDTGRTPCRFVIV